MPVLSGWLGWGPSFARGGCCSASQRASANTKCCVSECWPCCPLPSIAPCIITPARHPTPLPSPIQCYNPTPPPFPPGAGGSWGDLTLGSFPPPPWWGRRQGRVWGEHLARGVGKGSPFPCSPTSPWSPSPKPHANLAVCCMRPPPQPRVMSSAHSANGSFFPPWGAIFFGGVPLPPCNVCKYWFLVRLFSGLLIFWPIFECDFNEWRGKKDN